MNVFLQARNSQPFLDYARKLAGTGRHFVFAFFHSFSVHSSLNGGKIEDKRAGKFVPSARDPLPFL